MSRKDKSYAKAIPYPSTYLENGASSIFYIIDYEEDYPFQIHPLAFYFRFLFVASTCMTISRPKLEM